MGYQIMQTLKMRHQRMYQLGGVFAKLYYGMITGVRGYRLLRQKATAMRNTYK